MNILAGKIIFIAFLMLSSAFAEQPYHAKKYPTGRQMADAAFYFSAMYERELLEMMGGRLNNNQGMLNQMTICGEYSRILGYRLIEAGYDVWMNRSMGHAWLSAIVVSPYEKRLNEWNLIPSPRGFMPYILDMDFTYRQFFIGAAVVRGAKMNLMPDVFNKMKMPRGLVCARDLFRKTIESFPGKKNWELNDKYTYDFFYKPIFIVHKDGVVRWYQQVFVEKLMNEAWDKRGKWVNGEPRISLTNDRIFWPKVMVR